MGGADQLPPAGVVRRKLYSNRGDTAIRHRSRHCHWCVAFPLFSSSHSGQERALLLSCPRAEAIRGVLGLEVLSSNHPAAPSTGVFLSECPSSLFLDDTPFTVTVGVTDDFGSLVKGTAVLSSNITVIATLAEDSACSLGSQQNTVLDALDGQATLELQLRGKQESECVISFEYTTSMSRPITSGQCLVLVANCTNPDMDVVQQKEFDTCGFVDKSITPGTIALIILVVLLFLTVCLVYGILFIGWHRRRQRKARTTVANLEFEDVLKLGWSIESLLCDTSIRNIPFDCLLVHERIGVGASGIVSSAELFPEFPNEGERGGSAVPPLPRQVAVKELRLPTNLIGEAAMQAFVHEIQLLKYVPLASSLFLARSLSLLHRCVMARTLAFFLSRPISLSLAYYCSLSHTLLLTLSPALAFSLSVTLYIASLLLTLLRSPTPTL